METQKAISRNDHDRVAALQKYAILDTEPEQAFDDLTLLASFICKTPIASDFADRREPPMVQVQNRNEAVGNASRHRVLFGGDPAARRDGRSGHLAGRTIPQQSIRDSEPKIRFYAGAPLINEDGYALGTFCVIDKTPREFEPTSRGKRLQALSRLVLAQMEFRRNLQLLKEALTERTKDEHDREREIREAAAAVDARARPERSIGH